MLAGVIRFGIFRDATRSRILALFRAGMCSRSWFVERERGVVQQHSQREGIVEGFKGKGQPGF